MRAPQPTRSVSGPRARAFVRSLRREPGLVLAAVVWLVTLFTFSPFELEGGDATVQYGFVQKLYGDAPDASAYSFGLALLEAPFYGVGKLLRYLGLGTIGSRSVEQATIAVGMGLVIVPAVWALVWLLRQLDLPSNASALLAAAFGTPVFFYAVFYPGKDHAVDAALFTVVLWLAYRYLMRPSATLASALGAVIGFSVTVRYFAGAELIPLVLGLLLLRRWRDAALSVVAAAGTAALLALIPVADGVGRFEGGEGGPTAYVFAPLNPFRMLLSDHRGLFVWSPITVVAAVGLARLVRRRPDQRQFLYLALAMGASIMAAYTIIPFWDAGWSFSQRYFTPLFPLVVLGVASAFEARPRLTAVIATLCVCWSLFLCFNLITIGGPRYESTIEGGATDLARVPFQTHTSVGAYAWGVYEKSLIVRALVPWPGGRR